MSNDTQIYIEDEIKASYLDYSMSVIVSRALPDVRDGLKPVHRRILFAMHELGMTHDKPHKKSARIVGEVLGKYHPHGDSAVYQTMVRMAQDFNFRYELIDGHGNFGSIDGDSAAAMRYTEARMAKITQELLADIDKDTINYRKNFDDSLDEPVVLPAKLPNLLLNGTAGIAVGMATNIPPHNLTELVDGIVAIIDNPEITIDDITKIITGPDFPTAGIINGREGIYSAYATGRGKVVVRGRVEIEEKKNGKEVIIIKELPYQVNKAKLIEKIADLVRDKKITGITDLRDESDRDGIRVVIELKKGENNELILNKLYKYTELQNTFGIIMLALVDNQPRVLNLKEILTYYIKHRFEVVTRRTKFELEKAEKRAHILEGFRIALDHIDEIIRIIRGSKDTQEAMAGLMNGFSFSDLQARAILDMRLQRLTGLERNKIEEEYNLLMIEIARLKEILSTEAGIYGIIRTELLYLRDTYGDKRRTKIENHKHEIGIQDLIKDEKVIVTITNRGYIKRINTDAYKAQNRGGRGISAHSTSEEDFVEQMYTASKLDTLLIFSDSGKVYNLNVYEIPEATRQARGRLIENMINLADNEKVRTIIKIRDFSEDKEVMFLTRQGTIKKTNLSLFKNINRSGLKAINIKEDDDIISVGITTGNNEIFIATKLGYSIRFNEKDLRSMGRSAAGVIGIRLRAGDEVVSGVVISGGEESIILTITSRGFGKKTKLSEYNLQSRGGKGVINIKVTEKIGNVVDVKEIDEIEDIMVITSNGILIRTPVENIPVIGRATQGVTVMKVGKGESVVSVVKICKEVPESDEEIVEDEKEKPAELSTEEEKS
jgi:DNA gyrase subunit A